MGKRQVRLDVEKKGLKCDKPHSALYKTSLKAPEAVEAVEAVEAKPIVKKPIVKKPIAKKVQRGKVKPRTTPRARKANPDQTE